MLATAGQKAGRNRLTVFETMANKCSKCFKNSTGYVEHFG